MVMMMKNELVDIIYQALRRYEDARINDVSLDGDNDSSEVIITLDDGEQKKDFVISNNDIRELEEIHIEKIEAENAKLRHALEKKEKES